MISAIEGVPDRQWDVRAPREAVEILVNDEGTTLWINVDGFCLMRIQEIHVPLLFEQAKKGSKPRNLNDETRSKKFNEDRDLPS